MKYPDLGTFDYHRIESYLKALAVESVISRSHQDLRVAYSLHGKKRVDAALALYWKTYPKAVLKS